MRHSDIIPNQIKSCSTAGKHRMPFLLHTLAVCAMMAIVLWHPSVAGASTGTLLPAAGADTIESRLSYPVPAPSDPDIIAYSKRDGNRRYLHLVHVVTNVDVRVVHQTRREQVTQSRTRSMTRSQTEQLLAEAGLGSGYFEGDFVWHPGLDQFGHQWFAFVGTSAGKMQLHLGYVASGETLKTVVFPIGFGNAVVNPVFSPDGDALAFSADGQLYLVKDMDRVIRKRDFSRIQPRRITNQPNGAFFPSWSADGNLIAYQSRPDAGRRADLKTIFVTDVSSLPQGRLPDSHRISTDLGQEEQTRQHKRPSWAPSGNLLAWYEHEESDDKAPETEDRIRSNQEENETDVTPASTNIRLVRMEYDANRRTWVGMDLQRVARPYFAESVYAFPRSAPRWITLEYDRNPAYGIIWVRYAPDIGHPLHFSHLDYYADNRQDYTFNLFGFSTRFAWLERTVNNRYPTAATSDGHIRYVYVAGDVEQQELIIVDRQSPTVQSFVRKEMSEVPAVIRSGLYPGLGHYHIGEKRRGTFLGATFTALAGATLTGAVLRYRNEQARPENTFLFTLGGATAAAWTFTLIDLKRQFPAYTSVPVNSTFEGYRGDQLADRIHMDDNIRIASRRDALLLSALYPGLGQIYIGERTRGYVMGLTFTALAGSTVAGAAYRYHYPGQKPSNEVLIGLGLATFGTWIFNMIDVHQSFSRTFFAGAVSPEQPDATARTRGRQTRIALAPGINTLNIGNHAWRDYAAVGVRLAY